MKKQTRVELAKDWFTTIDRPADVDELGIQIFGTTEKQQQARNLVAQVTLSFQNDGIDFGLVERSAGSLAKYGFINNSEKAIKHGQRQMRYLNGKTELVKDRIELTISNEPVSASYILQTAGKSLAQVQAVVNQLVATASAAAKELNKGEENEL